MLGISPVSTFNPAPACFCSRRGNIRSARRPCGVLPLRHQDPHPRKHVVFICNRTHHSCVLRSFKSFLELVPEVRELAKAFYASKYTPMFAILDKIKVGSNMSCSMSPRPHTNRTNSPPMCTCTRSSPLSPRRSAQTPSSRSSSTHRLDTCGRSDVDAVLPPLRLG